jgi:hypothetical protein
MILPYARMTLAADWNEGRGLLTLLERFTGTERWDDPTTLRAAYERHNAEVRQTVPQRDGRHSVMLSACRCPIFRSPGSTAGARVPNDWVVLRGRTASIIGLGRFLLVANQEEPNLPMLK